jgi:hypothetical protein
MAATKKTQKLSRAERAQLLYDGGVRPVEVCKGLWTVEGTQGEYEVTKDSNGTFNCSCPDSLYRSHHGQLCYHAQLVQISEAAASTSKAYNELEAHLDIHLHKNKIVVF